MKQEKEMKISYWAAHFTTIVSVTLVLVLIGIVALIGVCADTETRKIKENIELNAIMTDSATNADAVVLAQAIGEKPYIRSVMVITKEEALKNWAADTGEDLMKLFGVNPLSPEVSFTVKAEYASEENMAKIASTISRVPFVEAVAAPDAEMVAGMNRNLENVALILSGVAVVLLLISFVLINNTVYLTIYSRRFTIHTMQLVGATNGFIRRPIVGNNLLTGVISGLMASLLIALTVLLAPQWGFGWIVEFLPWWVIGIVSAGLVIVGALICTVASTLATNRFLRKKYDDLFK